MGAEIHEQMETVEGPQTEEPSDPPTHVLHRRPVNQGHRIPCASSEQEEYHVDDHRTLVHVPVRGFLHTTGALLQLVIFWPYLFTVHNLCQTHSHTQRGLGFGVWGLGFGV